MNINTDSLVTFIIIWGIPTFMVARGYLKMNAANKKSALSDFKSSRFIFTTGFMIIGAFCTHLGILLAINIIELIGIGVFTLGGIFSVFDMWKISKIRSVFILVLVSIAISYLLLT
ncbi:hypothetical protein [Metabacillus fastidiosus]|uniref:hypothetical protein n=1 Tax=Metabacillus fastidiosus TaxID=1458 RepID=UPI002DBB96AD|nr:hypothetical protein [Metabacillus fastidiosus]MEC2075845.1 hypothetical protein [Metabacillus fastidiosus]